MSTAIAEPTKKVDRKKTFTILHTNDMHSNLIGVGPASDYTPNVINDDNTIGGFARVGTVIAERRKAHQGQGPVLVLDAGDYSMGTAFGAAIRETGSELQLLFQMGYDATTFGNHDFDLGPEGLAESINVAFKAGRIPAIVAANTKFDGEDVTLAELQHLSKQGVIRPYTVIERGGIRFGLFGVIGKESIFYVTGGGAIKFSDSVETANEIVALLREKEKVDVVICLSHSGMEVGKDGVVTDGDDARLSRSVPGIDVVVGGHSHTEMHEAIIVNDHTPVVQAGKYSENVGELVISLDGDKLTVESYELHPVNDTIPGDPSITSEINKFKAMVNEVVFRSRGYHVDQPLVRVAQDVPNKFTDIEAGTPLANFITDAFRKATGADIGFTANGMIRAGFKRGKSGIQTVYDVFAVTPLGSGIVDQTAGSALVTAYFTGQELKHMLEFFLIDSAFHPGEYFPRASGMRFRYNLSRPRFDVVIGIELGDLDHGYRPIDISGKNGQQYSLTCPLYLGVILVAIPSYSKGLLSLVPKNKEGQPLDSRIEALEYPRTHTPDLLPPIGTMDKSSLATTGERGALKEIKEWQAIMDHLLRLPVEGKDELPMFPIDEYTKEVRAITTG
jgi:5'-nucleotidase / UDP-sugar diphosphatase